MVRLGDISNRLADDPHIVDGAPCSIQVAGRKLQDEELLSVAELISSVLAT
jgi:amidase